MAKLPLKGAIAILMEAASRDVRGSGLGMRSTTEEWRRSVSEAWKVAFRYVHKRDPNDSDMFNAGMSCY
ncbi:MAG: hypothetical protein ACFFCW_30710 [Candidatus Hodarchaeota archaeon]